MSTIKTLTAALKLLLSVRLLRAAAGAARTALVSAAAKTNPAARLKGRTSSSPSSLKVLLKSAALLCCAAGLITQPAAAFFDFFGSSEKGSPGPLLKVCAVPQLYQAMHALQDASVKDGQPSFELTVNTATDLYAEIANNTSRCDLLLSASERFPILLIRSQKAQPAGMSPFASAPLVLYSADPELFKDGSVQALLDGRITSLALPKAELTPPGFAAAQVMDSEYFPARAFKDRIYRAEQEYQVYAMVSSGSVQAGFVTLPLIIDAEGSNKAGAQPAAQGSYWLVPSDLYPPIYYYALVLDGKMSSKAQSFVNQLTFGTEAQGILREAGFKPLAGE